MSRCHHNIESHIYCPYCDVEKLQQENQRFRESLKFYANDSNYDDNNAPFVIVGSSEDDFEMDNGGIARKALKKLK